MNHSPIKNLGSLPLAIGIEGIYESIPCRITRRIRYQGHWVRKYRTTDSEGEAQDARSSYQTWDMWELRLADRDAGFYIRQTHKSYEIMMPSELLDSYIAATAIQALRFGNNTEMEQNLKSLYRRHGEVAIAWGLPQTIEPAEGAEPATMLLFCELDGQYLELREGEADAPTVYDKYKVLPSVIRDIFVQHPAFRQFERRLSNLRWSANVLWVSALVLFLSWLFLSPKGSKVFEREFETALSTETLDSAAIFTLPKGLYITEVTCNIYYHDPKEIEIGAEVWVALYDDEEDIMIQEFGGDFWYASGVSEGERWLDIKALRSFYWYNDEEIDLAADVYVASEQKMGNARITLAVYEAGFMDEYLLEAIFIIVIMGSAWEFAYWSGTKQI